MALLKLRNKKLLCQSTRKKSKGQNLKGQRNTGAQLKTPARETQGAGTFRGSMVPRGHDKKRTVHLCNSSYTSHTTRLGGRPACHVTPGETVNCDVLSSTFQTLMYTQIIWNLAKIQTLTEVVWGGA